jgi:hypothetical protein
MSAAPADDLAVWHGGLRWAEAVRMQAARLEDSFYEYASAMRDARVRSEMTHPGRELPRAQIDRGSLQPVRVPTVALQMEFTTEADFLVVAVRNLLRAQNRLPDDLRTAMAGEEVLELLRNLAEHWDEVGGRSAERLAADHPEVIVGAVIYTNKEIWIGNVPLSRIQGWVARVEAALAEAMTRRGKPPLDHDASVVDGDDEIAWPSDRRRYTVWAAPRLSFDEWPTDPAPPELVELLARRFANLRARDVAD